MRQTDQRPRFGPPQTPNIIRYLVWTLLGLGLFTAIVTTFFGSALGAYTPVALLGLSKWGLSHYFLWQPVTFLFTAPGPLSLGLALYFFVELYLIWVVGTMVVERVGKGPFLRLFLITGALAGTAALFIGGGGMLAGAACAVYGLLIVWTMLNPDSQMLLFLTIPVQTRYLVVILLGLNLILDLSGGSYLIAASNVLGAAFGYLYALLAWELKGPFPFSQRFDGAMNRLGRRLRRRSPPPSSYAHSKIYDFKTGETVVDDAHFMDAMLNKISEKGEKSLSWRERRRMRRISRRRQKGHSDR